MVFDAPKLEKEMEESNIISSIKELSLFICSLSPQPKPPSQKFKQFKLFYSETEIIENCSKTATSFVDFLNQIDFRAYYNQSTLKEILNETNYLEPETFKYFERLVIQVVLSFLLENENGKFPNSSILLLQCLFKFITNENRRVFIIAFDLVLPIYADIFSIENYEEISENLFEKVFFPDNSDCPFIFSHLHVILRKILFNEGTSLSGESRGKAFLEKVTKILDKQESIFPKNECYDLFLCVYPMILDFNIDAIHFFSRIFKYIKTERIATFLLKFTENQFKYFTSLPPSLGLIFEKKEPPVIEDYTMKCFESPKEGLKYSKTTTENLKRVPFYDLLKEFCNMYEQADEVATVVESSMCRLIDSNQTNPSLMNYLFSFVSTVIYFKSPVPCLPAILGEPHFTTTVGRNPLWGSLYAVISQGYEPVIEAFKKQVEYPDFIAEVLYSVKINGVAARFVREPGVMHAFCCAGIKCAHLICTNRKYEKSWFEFSYCLQLILNDHSRLRIVMNKKIFVDFLSVALFDDDLRALILTKYKENVCFIVLDSLLNLLTSKDIASDAKSVIYSDILKYFFEKESTNVYETCIHLFIQRLPKYIKEKKIGEEKLRNFVAPLMKIEGNISDYYDDVYELFADGKRIKYPNALYLMFSLFNSYDLICGMFDDKRNLFVAQKCGFDAFIASKLSENIGLLDMFKKLVVHFCSPEACSLFMELFDLIDGSQRNKCFEVLDELLDVNLPQKAITQSEGYETIIPCCFNEATKYACVAFICVQNEEVIRMFSIYDANGEVLSLSASNNCLLINNTLLECNVPINKWVSIIIRVDGTKATVFLDSNEVGTLELQYIPTEECIFSLIKNEESETKIYGVDIFSNVSLIPRNFEFQGTKLVDLEVPYSDLADNSFHGRFLEKFSAEYLLRFFDSNKYPELDPIYILKALHHVLVSSVDDQKSFYDAQGIQFLGHVIGNLPVKAKTLDVSNIVVDLIIRTSYVPFQRMICSNILLGQNIFVSLPSEQHLIYLCNLKELYEKDPSSVLFKQLTIPRILSNMSLFYSYQINVSVGRDPFIDLEAVRLASIDIIIEESKDSFSENDFTCFVESVLYTKEYELKIGLLKGLSKVTTYSTGVDKTCDYLEPLSKLTSLLDLEDPTITCLVVEIIVSFSRHFKEPLIDHLIIVERRIMSETPSKELVDGLFNLMDRGFHELFEMCSYIAVKNNMVGFFNREITKIERSPFWCVWTIIGMLRSKENVYIEFLTRLKPVFWDDVIECLYVLSVSFFIDPRKPIIAFISNAIDIAMHSVGTYSHENVSTLIEVASHFILYGAEQSPTNNALRHLFKLSPFGLSLSLRRSSEQAQTYNNWSSLFSESEDLRLIMGSQDVSGFQSIQLRFSREGEWIDSEVSSKILSLMLLYKCKEHLIFGVTLAAYLNHVNPTFVRCWVEEVIAVYGEELDASPDLKRYLLTVNAGENVNKFSEINVEPRNYVKAAKEFQKSLKAEGERLYQLALNIVGCREPSSDNAAKRIRAIEVEMNRQKENNKRVWSSFSFKH